MMKERLFRLINGISDPELREWVGNWCECYHRDGRSWEELYINFFPIYDFCFQEVNKRRSAENEDMIF